MRPLPDLSGAPDDDVVQAAREGSEEAFQVLVRRYERRVYTLIHQLVRRRDVTEDLSQETFDSAFRRLRRYRPNGKFSGWILKIANNAALKHLRKRKHDPLERSVSADTVPLPSGNSSESTPAPRKKARKFGPEVYRAVEALGGAYREVFKLREFEDRSYEYIAHYLALPVGTVANHLHRARARLRAKLGPKWDAAKSDSTPTPA